MLAVSLMNAICLCRKGQGVPFKIEIGPNPQIVKRDRDTLARIQIHSLGTRHLDFKHLIGAAGQHNGILVARYIIQRLAVLVRLVGR